MSDSHLSKKSFIFVPHIQDYFLVSITLMWTIPMTLRRLPYPVLLTRPVVSDGIKIRPLPVADDYMEISK